MKTVLLVYLMNFFKRIIGFFSPPKKVLREAEQKERARNKKGHYIADDKSTPHVNEAYTTKKRKVSKKKKKATSSRGRKK